MELKKHLQNLGRWIRNIWNTIRGRLTAVRQWQWALIGLLFLIFLCVYLIPLLGRWDNLEQFSFWEGLERFGNITGFITVIFSIWAFLNTKKLIAHQISSERQPESEPSGEAFDIFVRVASTVTDSASMDDFLRHCAVSCPYDRRISPTRNQDGKTVHWAELFSDNNEQGFNSRFHDRLISARFADDGQRAKQRFMEQLKPVVIRYGAAAIRGRQRQAVYFIESQTAEQGQPRVDGEGIIEVYFPMDLPRKDPEQRRAFLAYFSTVLQELFSECHNIRLYYQGPTLLPCIIGDISNNNHIVDIYQYDRASRSYYRIGSSDYETLLTNFLDDIR